MDTPSNELKKPLAPTKRPTIIDMTKDGTQHKCKPPLLPKPNLKQLKDNHQKKHVALGPKKNISVQRNVNQGFDWEDGNSNDTLDGFRKISDEETSIGESFSNSVENPFEKISQNTVVESSVNNISEHLLFSSVCPLSEEKNSGHSNQTLNKENYSSVSSLQKKVISESLHCTTENFENSSEVFLNIEQRNCDKEEDYKNFKNDEENGNNIYSDNIKSDVVKNISNIFESCKTIQNSNNVKCKINESSISEEKSRVKIVSSLLETSKTTNLNANSIQLKSKDKSEVVKNASDLFETCKTRQDINRIKLKNDEVNGNTISEDKSELVKNISNLFETCKSSQNLNNIMLKKSDGGNGKSITEDKSEIIKNISSVFESYKTSQSTNHKKFESNEKNDNFTTEEEKCKTSSFARQTLDKNKDEIVEATSRCSNKSIVIENENCLTPPCIKSSTSSISSFLHSQQEKNKNISSPKSPGICEEDEEEHSIIETKSLPSTLQRLMPLKFSASESELGHMSNSDECNTKNMYSHIMESSHSEQKSKLISPIMSKEFQNELNNTLKRRSVTSNIEENISSIEIIEPTGENYYQSVNEEPEYWEIDGGDLPVSKSTNYSSQIDDVESSQDKEPLYEELITRTEIKEDTKDFPSDLSSNSDCSVESDLSWSDVEHIPMPINSNSLYSLVRTTVDVSEIVVKNTSSAMRIRSSIDSGKENSTKVKRTFSDRSTSSRPEDAESIGSNSTEKSFSLGKKITNFLTFNSFGVGTGGRRKRPESSFYCESSSDHSLTDTYSLNDNHSLTDNYSLNDNHNLSENHNPGFSNDLPYTPNEVIEPSIDTKGKDFIDSNIQDSRPLSQEELSQKKKRKAFLVAQEVMTSEKVFISVLSLLCKDMKKQCESDIPEKEIDKIINFLPHLLSLNENLLKDIEERIQSWETLPKIADIFVKKGPFLKLYSSYIQNFEAQCDFLDDCCQKYPLFSKRLKEFEMSEYCKKLSVKHYMLKPIQRIPQYRLLLEDYLSQLDSDSIDFMDTQKALQIVCDVADHANKSIKQGDHLSKLLQIQSQLGHYEIIKPGRVFIKEGELLKCSRRGTQERFFILLSDCLLYTSYYGTMTGLRVSCELPLNGMKVYLPQNEDDNNEFTIISTARSFILRARSSEERQDWIDALHSAIKQNTAHIISFLNRQLSTQISHSEVIVGKKAPVWIPDKRVTMCQMCTSDFTVTFRRHHCRGCGKVVCADCSDYKAPLQYMKFRNARVCQECFQYLVKEFDDPESKMEENIKLVLNIPLGDDISQTMRSLRSNFKKIGAANNKKYRKYVPQRLIEVTANDSDSQVSGWLFKKTKRNWKRCWFVLKEQVLYKYKASEDIAALVSIPVLGYQLVVLNEQDGFKFVFKLIHPGQEDLVFGTDNEKSFNRWVESLREASILK